MPSLTSLPRSSMVDPISVRLYTASLIPMALFVAVVHAKGAAGVVLFLVGTFGLLSVVAALADKPVALIGLLVVASAGQRAVAASTKDANALLLDDIVLVGLVLYLLLHGLGRIPTRTRLVVLGLLFMLALAVVRAPVIGIGISQFRQMLVPVVLILFGSVLRREDIQRAGPLVVGVILVGALYGLGEQFGWRPIDPLGAQGLNKYASANARGGLPSSYYYYFSDGLRVERSGGLILNPPSFGMLTASGILWAWFTRSRSGVLATVATIVLAAASILSFGRGGFVILALALVQPVMTRKSGRASFLAVGAVLGYVAYGEFSSDGESGRHVDGFFGGFTYALTHPLGGGFGAAGNALSQLGLENDSGAGESLAAILMASIGWLGIFVLGLLLLRGIAQGGNLAGVAITSAIIVSLVSETAGGLDATGPLWIIGGFALAALHGSSDDVEPSPSHSPARRRRPRVSGATS